MNDLITWAVCKNEGTATIFCMGCREQLKTVKIGEASLYMEDIKKAHKCIENNSKNPLTS